MARFMDRGIYSTWCADEQVPNRIADLHADNPKNLPALTVPQRTEVLEERRRQLRTFLSQIANCISTEHYATIMCHSTSLQWIYTKIRQDYEIQTKGVHFLNIIDIKYNAATMTPAGFYNRYRTAIINNCARRGETIHWNDGNRMDADKRLGPASEDHILLLVIENINSRLPEFIKTHYQLKLENRRLMDIRTDIFNNVTKFIGDIERAELLLAHTLRLAGLVASSIPGSPSLSAFSAARARQRGQTRGYSGYSQPSQRGNSRTNQATARKFCKTCYDSNFGKDVYLSHQVDDSRCPAKISLNQLLAEDKLPIEVQEQLIEENPDGNTSQVVSNTVCTHSHSL